MWNQSGLVVLFTLRLCLIAPANGAGSRNMLSGLNYDNYIFMIILVFKKSDF